MTCPEDSIFIQAILGNLPMEKKEGFINHVFSCPECRLKFEALNSLRRDLQNKADDFSQEALTKGEEREFRKICKERLRELKKESKPLNLIFHRFKPSSVFIAASFAVLICIAGFFLQSLVRQKASRASGNNEIRLIEPLGKVKSTPTVFRWSPLKRADGYDIKIVDEELRTIVTGGNHVPFFKLNDDFRKYFIRGKTYIWSVEAHDNENNPITFAQGHFIIEIPSP
jgi:hypothetical protein